MNHQDNNHLPLFLSLSSGSPYSETKPLHPSHYKVKNSVTLVDAKTPEPAPCSLSRPPEAPSPCLNRPTLGTPRPPQTVALSFSLFLGGGLIGSGGEHVKSHLDEPTHESLVFNGLMSYASEPRCEKSPGGCDWLWLCYYTEILSFIFFFPRGTP
jgi:hypothetical protein